VYWHLERVAQRLAALHRRRRFDRLILAGPEEATSELQRLLPRAAWRVAWWAVIPASLAATDREILDTTLDIEAGRAERDTEERLLGQLLDLAGPAGRAVLGVRPTLAAPVGRSGPDPSWSAFSASGDGSDCPNCRRLEPGSVERCPACGNRDARRARPLSSRDAARASSSRAAWRSCTAPPISACSRVGGGLGRAAALPVTGAAGRWRARRFASVRRRRARGGARP